MRTFALLSLIACLCIPFQCSRASLVSSGSSSSGNAKVSGIISKKSGLAASHTQVLLVASRYNPMDKIQQSLLSPMLIDTTDTNGRYSFLEVAKDTYSIEAKDLSDGTRLLVQNVEVGSDSIRIVDGMLQKPGSIKIVLSPGIDSTTGYIYIPGTIISTLLKGSKDFVVLDSVPEGSAFTIYYSTTNSLVKPKLIAADISVLPGSSTAFEYAAWLYSKKVYLNTTPSGANLQGTLVNFPLLVRLNKLNFNFDQALANGGDIRFTNKIKTLPYEIERWDASAKQAEIWVKMDTVIGNNAEQYIVVLWGNSAAEATSSAVDVFDTLNGFRGVWHLGQDATASSLDATPNHFDGTAFNVTNATGAIGMAKRFDGQSSYIDMQNTVTSALNFSAKATYSVSAWVYTDSLNGKYRIIASKGNKQYNLQLKNTDYWEFTEFRDTPQDSVGWEECVDSATAGSWQYVVGVRSGNRQYLYVNGSCVDSSIELFPLKVADTARLRDQSFDFMIGKVPDGQTYFFGGTIDEVRVSGNELSADWIKACYMNQRVDDKLVYYK